jgi:BlaI family transcriptional regulator, penicillinase repressor
MKQFKELSETEKEIMDVLWELDTPIATADLLSFFNNERKKDWKTQTISTFLARLVKKGFVISETKGRGTIHSFAVSEEEYNQLKAKSILKMMYKGSIKNFLVALYGDKKISNDEIAELKQWLSER